MRGKLARPLVFRHSSHVVEPLTSLRPPACQGYAPGSRAIRVRERGSPAPAAARLWIATALFEQRGYPRQNIVHDCRRDAFARPPRLTGAQVHGARLVAANHPLCPEACP